MQPDAPQEAGASAPGAKNTEPVMLASFGFGGSFPGDRWGPITVLVTAGDKPLAGSIMVEYPQDETQGARITVPFAATPNLTTHVPIVASIPSMCDHVQFTMLNERGVPTHRLTYSRVATDTAAQMPPLVDADHALVVSVGRTTVTEAARDWGLLYQLFLGDQAMAATRRRSAVSAGERDQAWSQVVGARTDLDELPIAWAAYDGVRVLVVNPQSGGVDGRTADPRAQAAVRTWVRSGGRLVVMADQAGDLWRQWLPEEARGMIELGPPTESPMPESVAGAIAKARTQAEQRAQEQPDNESFKSAIPAAAKAAPGRLLRLTAAGRDAGWKIRWALDSSGSQAEWAGLLAEGPAGYGMVTVLGMDPARAPTTLSTRATGAVWRSALETAMADWLEEIAQSSRVRQATAWGGWWQGRADRAANAVVERLGQVPVPREWMFVVIAGAMALLVAMVGPVDYFLLRRLGAGQRSWITALGWIGIASVAAYAGPRLVRTQPTQVNRVSVVDCIVPPLGRGDRLAFQTAYTGIYAGESGTLRFINPDLSSWWRGTSVASPWRGIVGQETAGAVVPTVQAAAGGEAGSARGNPLLALPISLWTFRAFNDLGIPGQDHFASGMAARVRETASGYEVLVTGLPEGATVTEAALRVGDAWLTIEAEAEPEEPETVTSTIGRIAGAQQKPAPASVMTPLGTREPASWTGQFARSNSMKKPPSAWTSPDPDPNQPWWPGYGGPNRAIDLRPGPLLDLIGPDRRAAVVRARVESGHWAAVYLSLTGVPQNVPLSWRSVSDHACVLRLLVPLDERPS